MLYTSLILEVLHIKPDFINVNPDELLPFITDLERVGEQIPANNTLPAKYRVI